MEWLSDRVQCPRRHQAKVVKRHGAAVVVMAFDEEGQAATAADKACNSRHIARNRLLHDVCISCAFRFAAMWCALTGYGWGAQVRICCRAFKILVEEVGFDLQDVIFDPNILTVGTGLAEHNNYAVDFFECVMALSCNPPHLSNIISTTGPLLIRVQRLPLRLGPCVKGSKTSP